MKELLIKVAAQYSKNLPFAVFCPPNEDMVTAYLQSNNDLVTIKDFDESGFAFCSFDSAQQYIIPEKDSEIICESKTSKGRKPVLHEHEISENGKSEFVLLVEKAIAKISSGELMKVVVSRKEIMQLTVFDLEKTFARLIANYADAFCYCFFHPQIGLWIGATPERLLNVDGLKFKTVALAGTQPRVDKHSVIWKDKEIEEQQFVSDFIEGNLQPLTTRLYITRPYTAWAGKLAHIKTDLSGLLKKSASIRSVLQTLHPTPAVCGLPKGAATKFILDNEGYSRSFYSGFLGLLNVDNKTDLYVNLRCMDIVDGAVNIFVGCGITKDSVAEKEFIETSHKALTMKSIL